MPAQIEYTRDGFRQVARRRIGEARKLLDVEPAKPKRSCDGAATCALLAAECALKAALLFSLDADEMTTVPPQTYQDAFTGKKGHNLVELWRHQGNKTATRKTSDLGQAIDLLHQLDRYQHRYGARRPPRTEALKAVEAAETIVKWMVDVVV